MISKVGVPVILWFGALVVLGVGTTAAAITPTDICTAKCDRTYTTGKEITMCGTDGKTHTTYFEALCKTSGCYKDECAVMTYYPGPCGCPNNCFASHGQGTCVEKVLRSASNSTCECSAGWTGKDCGLVSAGNTCGMHGTLVTAGSEKSEFPFDYCDCDDGFTGLDCSSPVFSAGHIPWGNIFDGEAFTEEDDYGDNHPVWNTSLIATIRIEMDEDLFLGLLQPWNSLNQTYEPATVHFDNGYVRETITNVGFKQKGSGCRKHQKHCWNIKFNEFVSGQKLEGIKKLGIKGGTDDDDVLAKYMMYVDMMRAVVAPTQRTSYTLMYINDVFFGLNLMHEDIDEDFPLTRIDGDDGEGNLMKFDGGVYLQYLGDDVSVYQADEDYEQAEGDGDWTDFVDFLYFLNSTTDEEFEEEISNRVDTDQLIRYMIIESFLMDTDGMTRNGRNYNTYHLRDENHPDKWELFSYDFDMCLEFNIDSKQPYMGERYLNIFTFFQRDINVDADYNPLLNRFLKIPKYNETFTTMYKTFLEATFGAKSPMQPSELHAQRTQFVLPWVDKDQLWQLSNGLNTSEFIAYAEYTQQLLNDRYYNISQQLDSSA